MIKPRPWPWIEFSSSRGQESKRLFVGQQQTFSISNFLEEISSLYHSIVFLYFFALITEEGFLIYPCYSLELCIQMSIFSSLPLKMGGEGINRGWDGWMASPTQWTWVWVNSRSWWWTGRSGVMQSMGSQSVAHDWVTELNWASFFDIWMSSSPSTVLGNTVFPPLNDLTTFVKNHLTICVKVLLGSEFLSIDL